MTDQDFTRALFGSSIQKPTDDTQEAAVLFGRIPPVAEDLPGEPEPITGPIIPGQEKIPAHVPRNATHGFLADLFN